MTRLFSEQRRLDSNMKRVSFEVNVETNIPRRGIARYQSQFPHYCVCEQCIYSHNRSAYSAAGKYEDRSWEYINGSQTQECGIWDWCRGHAIPFLGTHKWDFCYSVGHVFYKCEGKKQKKYHSADTEKLLLNKICATRGFFPRFLWLLFCFRIERLYLSRK